MSRIQRGEGRGEPMKGNNDSNTKTQLGIAIIVSTKTMPPLSDSTEQHSNINVVADKQGFLH